MPDFIFELQQFSHAAFLSPSLLDVLSLYSPPSLLCLLYALRRGYADQCPLNLSSASVCAKITGDSPPAASGANIRSLLLQGVPLLSLLLSQGDLTLLNPLWALLQKLQMGLCMKVSVHYHILIQFSSILVFCVSVLIRTSFFMLCIPLCIVGSIYSKPDWFYCPDCPIKLIVCF